MAEVRVEQVGSLTIAYASGELTATDAGDFAEALRDYASGAGARLAIDLSGMKMVDSSGLAALINLVNRARLSGGRVVLVAPSSFVAGIFNITRLDTWFDICKSIDDAKSKLG